MLKVAYALCTRLKQTLQGRGVKILCLGHYVYSKEGVKRKYINKVFVP